MATPRKPQDHLAKASETPTGFEFEHNGETFALASESDVLKVGWARKNRHRDPVDVLFTMLEEIAGEEALAAIDDMGKEEFNQFQRDFNAHNGVKPGE